MGTQVAVLGTGKMGSAIARRLADNGHEVTLWNRTRARAEQVGVGRVADTAAAAVAQAEVVISSLTGPDAIRETFNGAEGALAAARGQTFVEMSTAGPAIIAEMAPGVAATRSSLLDAPIVGVPLLLAGGAALIVVGGADADVARVRPLLELFGEVRHAGESGSGARLKLVANSMLGAVTVAAAELQVAGEATGLDPDVVFALLTRFVPALELRREGYLHDRHQPTLFALRDLHKDLGLAADTFAEVAATTPLTSLVAGVVEAAAAEAADLDISAVMRRYPRRLNLS